MNILTSLQRIYQHLQSAEEAVDFMYQSFSQFCMIQAPKNDYYKRHRIFIETGHGKHTPYILHAVHIMDNISMLILCEVSFL